LSLARERRRKSVPAVSCSGGRGARPHRQPQGRSKRLARPAVFGGGTPERFRDFIAHDIVNWRKVVNEAGIVAEAGR